MLITGQLGIADLDQYSYAEFAGHLALEFVFSKFFKLLIIDIFLIRLFFFQVDIVDTDAVNVIEIESTIMMQNESKIRSQKDTTMRYRLDDNRFSFTFVLALISFEEKIKFKLNQMRHTNFDV